MARVIAIDGPSGSGKSSTSRRVGQALGFLHVDSGALYRIMTWQCLAQGVETSDPAAVAACAERVQVECRPENGALAYYVDGEAPGARIRTPEINAHASPVATVKAVRDRITALLRGMTRYGDLVVEGRDITTVVFPDSPARFYLTASPEARARRRLRQLQEKGESPSFEDILREVNARDHQDMTRAVDPLRQAPDAQVVDSTNMNFEQTVQAILDIVEAAHAE